MAKRIRTPADAAILDPALARCCRRVMIALEVAWHFALAVAMLLHGIAGRAAINGQPVALIVLGVFDAVALAVAATIWLRAHARYIKHSRLRRPA